MPRVTHYGTGSITMNETMTRTFVAWITAKRDYHLRQSERARRYVTDRDISQTTRDAYRERQAHHYGAAQALTTALDYLNDSE